MKSAIEQLRIAEKDLGESCRKCCSMANNCCCYFVSKGFREAGNSSLFYGGKIVTYCPNAIKWCKTQLAQIPLYLAMPSDIIFFDWNLNGEPNHIGFVREKKSCTEIYTLEGNTNNGVVAYKTRPSKYIQGIYRPHFVGKYDISKPIAEDGNYGYSSIALTQKWLGVKVDGILGKGTVKALQKRLGITQDGSWGVGTSKALQKLIGTTADGYFGENSVKALQRYLNKQVFKTTAKPSTTPTTKPQNPTKPSVSSGKYKVIDVSVWQGTINWAKVKADGVVGAIIRYADGKTLDSKFDYNMKQAKANGLHIGAYIFSRAKTKAEAEAEATRLYNACKPYAPDLPLYIDLEASTLSKYADTVAQAFLNKMKALGGRGGVYANLTWWNKYLTKTAKNYSSNPFWIAQYNDKITHKTPSLFGMWQYSSSGSVKGISGKVDMDWLYTPYWETAPKPKNKGQQIADTALEYVGKVPYVKGGHDITKGVDCTGIVQEVYRLNDIPLTNKLSNWGKSIGADLSKAQPGDILTFKDKDGDVCHHAIYIGNGECVQAANAKQGVIRSTVSAIGKPLEGIRRRWQEATPTPTPTGKLTVDGIGGTATVKALQSFLGVAVDGVISGQTKSLAKYYPSLKSVEFGRGGSATIKALQKWLGIDQDGKWGKDTSIALQKKLGVTADGIFGTDSMKALQKYLNAKQK